MHKLSKKFLSLILAVVLSFTLVIPSVSAVGDKDTYKGDNTETTSESEIETYATNGRAHIVSSNHEYGQRAGWIYHGRNGSVDYYTNESWFFDEDDPNTLLLCVEYFKDFESGMATQSDVSQHYSNQQLAQLAIGSQYIEDNYKGVYDDSTLYLMKNVYVWRIITGDYDIFVRYVDESTQDSIYGAALSYANANIDNYDYGGTYYNMDDSSDQDVAFFFAEPDEPSYLTLMKSSSYSDITANNTCYSLEGAVYNIYTDNACTSPAYETYGNQAVLTTKSDGTTNTVELEEGTYYVKEITASKGYNLDTNVYTVNTTSNQTTVVYSQDPPVDDMSILQITKVSDEDTTNIQSLAGAQFTIHFYGGEYTLDEINAGKPTSDGVATRTWVLETKYNATTDSYWALLDDDYLISGDALYKINGLTALPLGTITIEETKAPEGYTLDGYYISDSYGTTISDSNGVVCMLVQNFDGTGALTTGNAYTKSDKLIRGGVEIYKKDYETKENTALGDANLQAIFTIYNMNDYIVTVNGDDYESGQAVYSMTTDAETGYATTSNDLLPYGHYKIVETKLPEGYTGEGITEQEFDIKDNGVIVDLTGSNSIYNQVVRADFEIHKTDDNGEPMANVEFEIKSETTGETHYFVTDEDGYYSSSSNYVLHSDNTNTSRNLVTAHEGIWFGEDTEVNDELGALPYDTYTISEIRTEDANWSYIMQTQTFTVTGADNEVVIDLDVVNPEMRIVTEAVFTDIDSHYHIADGTVTVRDSVAYENFLANHSYYIECFLYDVTTGEYINADGNSSYDSNGNIVSNVVTTHITTGDDKGDGTADGSFTVEFELDLSQYAGHQIVVYEDVYDVDQPSLQPPYVCEENPLDAMQTLYIPEIHTTALDSETGNHMSYCDDDITIVDTVDYTCLEVGTEYTVYGTLMNKDTGEVVLDKDGNEIVAETTFVPETADGSVDVVFNFDGTGLDGIVTVVFEDLYSEGIEYAVHTDITDEGQTVYIPKIHTLAWADETGTNLATATTDTVLYDTVWYSGLQPGEDYHVFGVLLDAETREAERDSNGNEIYSDYGPFTAESTEGQVTVEYNIDASQLAGRRTVFFEILYHVDYEDEDIIEEIDKELLEETSELATGYNEDEEPAELAISLLSAETTFVNQFEEIDGKWYYTGEIASNGDVQYGTVNDVTGWWYISTKTGEVLLDYNGMTMTPLGVFDVVNGLVQDYTGEIPGSEPDTEEPDTEEPDTEEPDDSGDSEPVVHTGTPIYTLVAEEDIADAEQETIYFPEIGTTAWDIDTESHVSHADDDITIIDTVEYTHLATDKEYTLTGTLMNKEICEPMLDDNGNEITAITYFTPKTTDGTVDVTFTFPGATLADNVIVAFEELYYEDTQLTVHTDIDDEGQTVYIPKIHTTAINQATGTHEGTSDGIITIVDTVEYTNLLPDAEYTMTGELYNAETGNSMNITAETTFIPETTDGSVDMMFEFDASSLGDITIAVYEYCYYNGNLVAEHTDITDTDQQVKLSAPIVPPEDEGGEIQTGEIIALSALGVIALAAVIVLIVTSVTRKKKV